MRALSASLATAVSIALRSALALAQPCTCPAARPPATALAESDAVFEGQVTAIREGPYVSGPSETVPGRWVTLLVLREWKGATAGTTRHIFTPTSCDVPFESGIAWLVYARHGGANHDLRTTRCQRTRPVPAAREDLVALGIPGTQIMAMAPATTVTRPASRPAVRRPLRRTRRVLRRRRR